MVRSPSYGSLQAAAARGTLSPAQQGVFLAPRPEEELYHTVDDPDQLKNLAGDATHAGALQRLRGVMAKWREETADSAPPNPTVDGFHRETGERIFPAQDTSYYRTPAGSDRGATLANRPGPF